MPPALRHQLLRLRRIVANLPRRAWLTWKYNGPREFLYRALTFPLRFTPLGSRLGLAPRMADPSRPARMWYRRNARPVAVVIPTYGPTHHVEKAVRSIRRTTKRRDVRIIVCDDGSAPEHVARLRVIDGIELVEGGEQRGFAANCNRGLRLRRPNEDAVLLNSDVVCHPGWLEVLQHAAHVWRGGIVGGRLLYPDGTIQWGGTVRNADQPEWFDHRFRFKPADFPPATAVQTTLAVTGACMYLRADVLDEIGLFDEAYGMAYEDVDLSLRAWDAGHRVLYAPAAILTHEESKTRGMAQGERELTAQRHFWQRWSPWMDRRDVHAEDGEPRIVYVTHDVGVGGGHRVIFTHLNGLAGRGFHAELWTLGDGPPDWFDLRVPVRTFADYDELVRALSPVDAIKVATWWETAPHVWDASVVRGIPVYLVQDIETSYYSDGGDHGPVLATYRPEFEFLCGSSWVRDELLRHVPHARTFTPGLDLDLYRQLPLERHPAAILALGRSNPLKDFPLTRQIYLALPEPRPELWLYGIEPELAEGLGDRVRYHEYPSDEEVVALYNRATLLLQTSKHEGFCLPPLEAMACGTPVVTTDANSNRDFCVDGVNCLMPASRDPRVLRDAVQRLLTDEELRRGLIAEGLRTAESFAWPRKLDELAEIYRELAASRAQGAAPGASTPRA